MPGNGAAQLALRALPDAILRPAPGNAFENTVEQLARAIRLGVLADGEQLPPERELAERLGVSRNTLRDAIAALRDASLVTTKRGRGGGTRVTYAGETPAAVGPPRARSGAAMDDALAFRRVVEPGAAWLAATRPLSADQRAWLTESAAEVDAAADPAVHRVADSRLHLAIAALAGSPMLVDAVTRAQAALHEMLMAIPVLRPNIEHSTVQHHQVVTAILSGDADRARAVMEEHCDATSALLRGLIG
ncbi:MAG TPA: FCD domain-containing protein [Intrasporangium sp.]|uniref:FadR/GntR family transcriptional regulator n=1 Tax=Intrasporangium sp. TaxID=1925024 RepID=UPI002D799731|nr:FCD domain-containing protein [Intrasporangium sp.]HET7397729.1 FCD domain-containing protein [Intrasporangium sp.]